MPTKGGEPYVCPKCGHMTREVETALAAIFNKVRCESCNHTASLNDFLAGKRKPHGQTRALKNFAPGGLCAPKPFDPLAGPDGERPTKMSFGEQFVELLGEFVDAREEYAHARRVGEDANPDDMNEAGDRLQKLIDKRLP